MSEKANMERIVDDAIKQVAAGTLDFLGYVKLLTSAGVHCYTVDLETHDIIFYAGTKSLIRKLILEPTVFAGRFNVNMLKEAIGSAQRKSIDYFEFLERIAAAGVEIYEADFKAKHITYRGRRNSYVEPFVLPK